MADNYIDTSKPTGGSAIDNSIANATFTTQELAQWIDEDPANAISFAITRNPSKVYEFIRLNWGDAYPLLKDGAQATYAQMESMQTFLDRQYTNYNDSQRLDMVNKLIFSLPKEAELLNWTTPVQQ